MPEPYAVRKKRILRAREALPEGLREVPLRYVEDVAGLSPAALRLLERAYRSTALNIPRALKYIRENLVLSLEDLCEFARPDKPGPKPGRPEAPEKPSHARREQAPSVLPYPRDVEALAGLLITCYPSMPRVTAEAMAQSDVLGEALKVVVATREALESDHARSDFVILTLHQLFAGSAKQVLKIIQGNPAFHKAYEQSRAALDNKANPNLLEEDHA